MRCAQCGAVAESGHIRVIREHVDGQGWRVIDEYEVTARPCGCMRRRVTRWP